MREMYKVDSLPWVFQCFLRCKASKYANDAHMRTIYTPSVDLYEHSNHSLCAELFIHANTAARR